MRLPLTLLRESFGAKVALALLGTVGLVLAATLLAVRHETSQQVQAVTERAAERSSSAFREIVDLKREQLERSLDPITNSRRTVALVEADLEAGDLEHLTEVTGYELSLAQIGDQVQLWAFADDRGRPALTVLDGERTGDPDPADVETLVARILDEGLLEASAFRLVDGRLFLVQARALELGRRFVGAVAFGTALDDRVAEQLGSIVGAEVCLVAGDRCVVGTPLARSELGPSLASMAGSAGTGSLEAGGERWEVLVEELNPEQPGDGWRVLAMPLEPVLAPFERISRALLVTGLGALLLAGLAAAVLSAGLTGPVRRLVEAVGRVGEGDYETTVQVETRDEIGVLAEAFNDMTQGLKMKEQYRGVLNKVVSREIAEELMKGEVVLGGENREVTVLFADVRGFTSLTEGMEPQEVIGLLNQCMERMSSAVEEEGGVVDKYVGDELMAIFGAPVSKGQDALRAVRAAQGIQTRIGSWNRERETRGLLPIRVGIGINTGTAVAGNMGSPDRLNYTVLGESVNLASRLCSAAAPGEIRISEHTLSRLDGQVEAEPAGREELKGFSRAVDTFRVTLTTAALLLAVLLAGVTPRSAEAQEGPPTLDEMGVGYVSESGFFQLAFSGRTDLEAYFPGDAPSWIIPTAETFVAPRARLFVDAFFGSRFLATVELRGDRGEEPTNGDLEARIDQAFLQYRVLDGGPALSVRLGKFASPFGGYALRHHTDGDPFVRPPLMYDHRTLMPVNVGIAEPAEMMDRKMNARDHRRDGAPVVWGVPYQWGAMAFATAGSFDLGVAAMNSAPSSSPKAWELRSGDWLGKALVVNAGWQATPSLRLDGYWSRGPFPDPGADLCAFDCPREGGPVPEGWDQILMGGEITYFRGPLTLRGEVFMDRWEVAEIEDEPEDLSWYAEGQLDLFPGAYVALRWSRIDFRPLDAAAGLPSDEDARQWDFDASRIQAAAGYRLYRNLGVKAELTLNDSDAPNDPDNNLISLQAWWAY